MSHSPALGQNFSGFGVGAGPYGSFTTPSVSLKRSQYSVYTRLSVPHGVRFPAAQIILY
jgi:hypothetical protein